MADRVDFYFRQRVTEAELDLAFALLEKADRDYRDLVEGAGGRRSMSRKADCYDNAVAESIFRTIKEEDIGEDVPDTLEEARRRVFSFIEGFCNSERLHSTLGYRTPLEFEKLKIDEQSRKAQSSQE